MFIGGVLYALTVAFGMATFGFDRPIEGAILAVMEYLTVAVGLLYLVVIAALHSSRVTERNVFTLLALIFAALLAGTTSLVHFIQLSALNQLDTNSLEWPSALYAAELFAWDVFLGLSLICAALALRGTRLKEITRTIMYVCGALCLLGIAGPLTGDMRVQFVAMASYGLLLPIVCLLLSLAWKEESGA